MTLSYRIAAVFAFDSDDSLNLLLQAIYEAAGELEPIDETSHDPEETTDIPLYEVIYELPTETEALQLKEKLDEIKDVIANIQRVTHF